MDLPKSGSTVRSARRKKPTEMVTNMRRISTGIFRFGLGLILTSLTVSGCATLDGKRDDETYKRPAKLEQGPTEAPRKDYPDLRTPVPSPEPMPEVPLDQLPVEPLDQNA